MEEKEEGVIYHSDTTSVTPPDQISDFNIHYSWTIVFEEPTDNRVFSHIRDPRE